MAVEGLVLTKPAYITTISQQNQIVLRNVHIFLINTKAPHGQAMALCRLCEKERERERASIETTLNSIQSSWRGSWNLSKRKQKPEVDHQTLRVCRCHKQEHSTGTRELQMSSPPSWEEMGVHRTQESIPGKKVHFENWQIPFCKSRCPARSFLPLSSSLLAPFCFNCPGQ